MIPHDWTAISLANITREQVIGTGLRGQSFGPTLPLLKMGNLLWGGLNLREIEQIGVDVIAGENCRIRHGDVLFNTRNTPELVGKTAFWDAPFEAAIDNNIMRIRLKEGSHPEYVALWLASDHGRKAIGRLVCASTSVGAVYWRDLCKLVLPLPPLLEQRRISEILSTWDQASKLVAALITNARDQKKVLMQSLLTGKVRLPGFSGSWTTIKLGDGLSERSERGDDNLPLLSVTQSEGVIYQKQAGRKNISSVDQSNYKTVRTGDIAYNTMRMWQGASALSGLNGKVSPAYTIVTPREGQDAHFYAYLFKWPSMIHVFERHSQGLVSDTWNLKYPHFAKIVVRVPSLEEQIAIRRVLETADEELVALKNQLTALRKEMSALMQQLLTGKRRVKVSEEGAV